jgi:hypothetical protein
VWQLIPKRSKNPKPCNWFKIKKTYTVQPALNHLHQNRPWRCQHNGKVWKWKIKIEFSALLSKIVLMLSGWDFCVCVSSYQTLADDNHLDKILNWTNSPFRVCCQIVMKSAFKYFNRHLLCVCVYVGFCVLISMCFFLWRWMKASLSASNGRRWRWWWCSLWWWRENVFCQVYD